MWFNTTKYNFWPVYESIAKYYPIGIPKEEDSRFPLYTTYPGWKALVQLLDDNFYDTDNKNNLQSHWKDLEAAIQSKLQKKFVGTTYGQIPCLSAYIEIEKKEDIDVIRTKELHFFVSLLGSFYTIIGQDKSEVRIDYSTEKNNATAKYYPAVHYLVVSPEGECADSFSRVCALIEERFSGYRFVPFYICKQKIIGLELPFTYEKSNSIFNALFSPDSIQFQASVIGDESFKADDWVKEGYIDDGSQWHSFPPDWTEEQRKAIIENAELNQ